MASHTKRSWLDQIALSLDPESMGRVTLLLLPLHMQKLRGKRYWSDECGSVPVSGWPFPVCRIARTALLGLLECPQIGPPNPAGRSFTSYNKHLPTRTGHPSPSRFDHHGRTNRSITRSICATDSGSTQSITTVNQGILAGKQYQHKYPRERGKTEVFCHVFSDERLQ